MTIIPFWSRNETYQEFSNFYRTKFTYKGHTFMYSEQAFMWEKAITFNNADIAQQILKSNTPKEAKALGRKVIGYIDSV